MEGRNFKVTIYYENKTKPNPEDEDGSLDLEENFVFSELQYKKRNIQIGNNFDVLFEIAKTVDNHSPRSKMFKPEISAIFPIQYVLRNNEVLNEVYRESDNSGVKKYNPRNPILKPGEVIYDFSNESLKEKILIWIYILFLMEGKLILKE